MSVRYSHSSPTVGTSPITSAGCSAGIAGNSLVPHAADKVALQWGFRQEHITLI